MAQVSRFLRIGSHEAKDWRFIAACCAPARAAFDGAGYTRSHHTNHANPRIPENAKAVRHPNLRAIHGIHNAASAPPMLDPLSKMATASPRSCGGKHSATALLAPGQLKPSPIPSRNRRALKVDTEFAKLVVKLTRDHHTTAIERPSRVPAISRKMPPKSHVSA